jgi:4-diphosphocytidyl-2-C-methyl-D-erythritol kinase
MKYLALKAYAKINLYLRVLGKREDGYHELETLFERISLYDDITFSRNISGKEIQLEVVGADLPTGSENLVCKAVEQFRRRFKIHEGIRIQLVKRIPIAAGLGGGSSDAATVLLGLNRFWKVQATLDQLIELGGRIGADVPFFLLGVRRAIGKGRGDVFAGASLKPTPARKFYLIATPRISVLTKDVYEGWDKLNGLTPPSKNDNIKPNEWVNDLEPVVIQKYEQVSQFSDTLRHLGLLGIRLSGSGPAFFTKMKNLKEANCWAGKIRSVIKDCQVHCVQGC